MDRSHPWHCGCILLCVEAAACVWTPRLYKHWWHWSRYSCQGSWCSSDDIHSTVAAISRASLLSFWLWKSVTMQVYQHLYLGLLYGLLAIKSIFHDDFSMIAHGYIGVIPVNHIHLEEKIVFVVGKAFYFIYYLLIPALFSHHSLMESFELWIIAQLITGWVLAFSFQVRLTNECKVWVMDVWQVNHVTEGADFYKTDDDSMPIGWTRSQIEGTSDFAHGSWFWTNVTGGLNYQVSQSQTLQMFTCLSAGCSPFVSMDLSYALSRNRTNHQGYLQKRRDQVCRLSDFPVCTAGTLSSHAEHWKGGKSSLRFRR